MSINQLWWNSRKPSDAAKSNFEIFLDSVSPMVSIKPDSKIKVRALKSLEEEEGHEREGESVRGDCFLLSELWKAYANWSGFGADSPFILENGNTVIQFYHPTLSALQIYTTQPYANSLTLTLTLSDSEGSAAAGSSDQEMEEGFEATEDDALTLTAQLENGQQTRDQLGHLYLHYNEESDPDKRPPFFVKINELADTYPALMTLKSTDLSPDSWVAIDCFRWHNKLVSEPRVKIFGKVKDCRAHKMKIEGISVEGGVDCSLVGYDAKNPISWRDERLA